MKCLAQRFKFYSSLFCVTGAIYWIIEILWKQHSHWSMFVVAGISAILGDLLNEITPDMKVIVQSFLITILILLQEYLVGIMFNYDYSIWDYRGMPFNYEGHITLSFAILWFVFISPFIIWWGDKWRGKM
jgi:uncharacterized membrane protein